MPTKKKLPRINSAGGDLIIHNSDNSFWFANDISYWIRGYKTRTRNRKNEFKDHEDKVMDFKRKML
jgi:hypothetical protein